MTPTPSEDFCFVHAADLHLDTPFRGLQSLAPEVAAALREASLDAFDAVVALALERSAAFALFAGDIYDGAQRGLRAQLRFRDGLARLSEAGIPSFVVHGNHDPVEEGWSAIADWPDRVTVFPSGAVRVVDVEIGGTRLATVQGISYAHRQTRENLALRLSRPPGPGVHVGVLHCNVAGVAEGYDDYSPCTLEDLRATGLDYLALGHVHQRRILQGEPGHSPWIVYPGNTQARSPRPSEQEAKGATVVHVEAGAISSAEFVACDRVRYLEELVAIEGLGDLADLHDAIATRTRDALAAADGRSVVCRVRLTGRGELHRVLARPGALGELTESVRDGVSRRTPFTYLESIVDQTAPAVDEAALRERGDFAADLLAFAEELDAHDVASLGEALLAGAPRSLAARAGDLLSRPGASSALLARARLLALDEVFEA